MSMKHALWIAPVALLASCDKAKAFIDPSGNSYGTPAAPATAAATGTSSSAPASSAAPAQAPSAQAVPAAGRGFDAPIRTPAVGRNLTTAEVLRQLPAIEFQDKQSTWTFHNGIGRCGTALASLVDSAGKPWGLSVGDLDMDGSDDAVVLVRLDKAGAEPRWELAFLRNQDGRLFNTQTVPLPGSEGYRDVDIQGSAVVLVPEVNGPNVLLSYSGGELALSRP
jgi:hypothetical protein